MTTPSPEMSVGLVEPKVARFDSPFTFANGEVLECHELVYETYGELNSAGDNAVLICHALSGSHHAAGFHSADDRRPGWWDLAIGPGNQSTPIGCLWSAQITSAVAMAHQAPTPSTPLPTNHGVVNFLSLKSVTGFRAKNNWPVSGISRWAAVMGGSLGGMQALRWAVDFPDWVEHCVALAAAPGLTAQNIAFNEIARHAILSDPDWSEGDYLAQGKLPTRGVALARMVGHLTYMSADGMSDRFGRELREGSFAPGDNNEWVFQVESYLRHQGARFSTQFDANTYVLMTRALDLFDLASDHEGDLISALSTSASILSRRVVQFRLAFPAAALCRDSRCLDGRRQISDLRKYRDR